MAFHVLWRMLLMFDLKLIPEPVTFAFNTCDEYSFMPMLLFLYMVM